MTPTEQMEHLRANRLLYCWWCDRPIAVDQTVVADALGRPLHVGGCAELSAEYDRNEGELSAEYMERGGVIGDDYWYICNAAMAWLWNSAHGPACASANFALI